MVSSRDFRPRCDARDVTSAAMAAACGRGLLAPLGGRLRACPRASLRSLTSAAPLYDVVVSGGGMVGSAMAAALGKAVTFSAAARGRERGQSANRKRSFKMRKLNACLGCRGVIVHERL